VATGVKMDVTATIKRSGAIAIGVAGLIAKTSRKTRGL
jgi:hypothetical protein